MKKEFFLHILKKEESLTPSELEQVQQMEHQYPFCALTHFLIAKTYYQNQSPDSLRYIRIAAAYASDRKRLKQFVNPEAEAIQKANETSIKQNQIKNILVYQTEQKEIVPDQNQNVADEILNNLRLLKEAQEKAMSQLSHTADTKVTYTPLSSSVEEEPREENILLDYLQSLDTQKDYKTEEDKKRLQWELIERFIHHELSEVAKLYAKKGGSDEEHEDLSMPSVREDSTLISENLAVIMAKQGKMEKALDIYRKLIWKYPDKKAYFVSRIEELKNII